jgi:hypothetical protein
MALFGGRRRSRSGGVADMTPPQSWAVPAPVRAVPAADPLLDDWIPPRRAAVFVPPEVGDRDHEEWDDDQWDDERADSRRADQWDDEAWDGDDDWERDPRDAERAVQSRAGSLEPARVDQDDEMVLRRRPATSAKEHAAPADVDVLVEHDNHPVLPLPASFRPLRHVATGTQRHLAGAGEFPDAALVDSAPVRSTARPYRLDPFIFDPSSILVNRLGWYIDSVDVGAASGFEALVFGVGSRPRIGAQLIVPSAIDGWTFDSAVGGLTDVQIRTSGESDTAVGFDREGNTVCVVLLQHVDVYAVRLKATSQFAVAVEVADRYAQVIDDEL